MKKITILTVASVALFGAVAGLHSTVKADDVKTGTTDVSAKLTAGAITLSAPATFGFADTAITSDTISFTQLAFDQDKGVQVSDYAGDGATYNVSAKISDDTTALATLGSDATATVSVDGKALTTSDAVVQTTDATPKNMTAAQGVTKYPLKADLKLSKVSLAGTYKGTVTWTLGTASNAIAE